MCHRSAAPGSAGPSARATVLLLVSQQPERRTEWIGALCLTMLVSATVLVLSERILLFAGTRLMAAVERLMGLVLVSVAIEMMLRGARTFAKHISAH
jgi:small neutral amino acid transporter SnatA (MarC family)